MYQKFLYRFLELTRGSWRNAIYVECSDCVSGLSCSDLLLATNDSGAPVVISVNLFQTMSGATVDKQECAGVITKDTFLSLFHRWLLWNISDSQTCPIPQLLRLPPDAE